jgi:hypothetical protein
MGKKLKEEFGGPFEKYNYSGPHHSFWLFKGNKVTYVLSLAWFGLNLMRHVYSTENTIKMVQQQSPVNSIKMKFLLVLINLTGD